MTKDLVVIHYDEVRAGTFLIAKSLEREHRIILEMIDKYKDRFLRLENNNNSVSNIVIKGLVTNKITKKTAGRPVVEYLLNEQQTIFLIMLLRNTEIVLNFKEKVASEFVKMKCLLEKIKLQQKDPAWVESRDTTKVLRLSETDAIKAFVQYAIDQGASEKGANMYYVNITRMMNTALFIIAGRYKNLRDVLTTQQLFAIGSAEQIIQKAIIEGMKKKLYYKDIYKLAKERTKMFAEMHGQSEVFDKQLSMIE